MVIKRIDLLKCIFYVSVARGTICYSSINKRSVKIELDVHFILLPILCTACHERGARCKTHVVTSAMPDRILLISIQQQKKEGTARYRVKLDV